MSQPGRDTAPVFCCGFAFEKAHPIFFDTDEHSYAISRNRTAENGKSKACVAAFATLTRSLPVCSRPCYRPVISLFLHGRHFGFARFFKDMERPPCYFFALIFLSCFSCSWPADTSMESHAFSAWPRGDIPLWQMSLVFVSQSKGAVHSRRIVFH